MCGNSVPLHHPEIKMQGPAAFSLGWTSLRGVRDTFRAWLSCVVASFPLCGKSVDSVRRRRGRLRMRWLDGSPTLWTWIWASFQSWWWSGKPGVLQSTGLQRVGHDWGTELNGLCWDHVQHLTRLILFRLSLHPKPCPSKQGFLLSFPSSLILPPFYLGDGGVGSVSHWFIPLSEQCVRPLLSCVWLFATPWTVAHQSPLSVGFPRQEYWSGLPFPSPGDLLRPGMKP